MNYKIEVRKMKMKKLTILLAIASLGIMIASFASVQGQGMQSEMNTQIIGYYEPYGLYVTAPLNTSVEMINDFSITLRSPGTSTYSITLNSAAYASGQFDYLKVLYFNTTFSGTDILKITMYSSILNETQTFQYDLIFVTYSEYVSYVTHQTKPIGTITYGQLEEDISIALVLFAILTAISEREQFKRKVSKILKMGAIRSG